MNSTPSKNLVWLVMLLVFWAFYGLTGRDAWKAEEALALTPILDWLDGRLSISATPAPLYTLVAGILIKLNLAAGDVQDGARLASGLFTCIALLFTGLSARAQFGPGYGPAAAVALAGGFGLMLRAHALLPETALLAAWSVLLYGVISAQQKSRAGMLAIGLALTMLLLGLRGLPDLLAALALLLLPLFSPVGREREYRKNIRQGLVLAALLSSLGLIYLMATGDLSGWLPGHGLEKMAALRTPSRAFAELPWFTWPLWPLALAAIWHAHRRLARTLELHLALLAVVVLLLAALVPAWSRDGALLPILAPLAVLSAYGLENMRRGAAQAFYWFGVLFFVCFVLVLWVYFAAIEWGYPAKLASHMAQLTPSYTAGQVGTAAYWVAGAATLIWIIAIPLFPRAKIRPILVWATGMILVWTLIATLFHPWVESGWAYRPMIVEMSRHLPKDACLRAEVDPAMRTMLRLHLKHPVRTDCAWTLKQVERTSGENAKTPEGRVIWEGFRPRQKSQIYQLLSNDLSQP